MPIISASFLCSFQPFSIIVKKYNASEVNIVQVVHIFHLYILFSLTNAREEQYVLRIYNTFNCVISYYIYHTLQYLYKTITSYIYRNIYCVIWFIVMMVYSIHVYGTIERHYLILFVRENSMKYFSFSNIQQTVVIYIHISIYVDKAACGVAMISSDWDMSIGEWTENVITMQRFTHRSKVLI